MTRDDIRAAVVQGLTRIAPESDPAGIDPGADLREELDIDSMDFLRFVTGLHESLSVEIPEADYTKMGSLDACVAYLAARLAAA